MAQIDQNIMETWSIVLNTGQAFVLTFDPIPDRIAIAQMEAGGDVTIYSGVQTVQSDLNENGVFYRRGVRLVGNTSVVIPGRSNALSLVADANSKVCVIATRGEIEGVFT
jgi:hypothetical protein